MLAVFAVVNVGKALGCDICGCGVGSYYLGILPEFNQRFAGIRYQFKTMETHLSPSGARTPLSQDETYQSMEVWGGFNLGSRWRLMGILPYNFNQRTVPSQNQQGAKSGLGDAVVLGYYKIFEQTKTTEAFQFFNHSLWVGTGIKAPTGQYDSSEESTVLSGSLNSFQLGTGSTDLMLLAAYDARLMDFGMNFNTSFKANSPNSSDYRYGNKLTGNLLIYRKISLGIDRRIAPNLGFMYESQRKDERYGRFYVNQSGGTVFSGVVGVEVNVGKFSFGGNYQSLLHQNLAQGRAKAGNRLMFHFSMGF